MRKNQTENLELKNVENTEERISELEDCLFENRGEKRKQNENHLQDVENYVIRVNLRIIGVKEGIEKEQGAESMFKEIKTKLPKHIERYKYLSGIEKSEITKQI